MSKLIFIVHVWGMRDRCPFHSVGVATPRELEACTVVGEYAPLPDWPSIKAEKAKCELVYVGVGSSVQGDKMRARGEDYLSLRCTRCVIEDGHLAEYMPAWNRRARHV